MFAVLAIIAARTGARSGRRDSLIAVTTVLAFTAVLAAEIWLGRRGMPRRYAAYIPEFAGAHLAVGIAHAVFAASAGTMVIRALRAGRHARQLSRAHTDAATSFE